jgi:alkylation response protein AidB-like acyl-CoA dehydrogenase
MDYEFNDQEKGFIDRIRDLADTLATDGDLETGDTARAEANLRTTLERLARTPYLGVRLAGQTADAPGFPALVAAMETLGAASPSLLLSVESSTRIFGRLVRTWGGEAAEENWLLPLTRGRLIGAVALSEGAMNVENDPLTTTGREDGGDIVVRGRKQYVVNAPVADWIAVAGRIDRAPALFMVKKGQAGLRILDRIDTLGYDDVLISGIELADCRIPRARVLCPETAGSMIGRLRMWENQVLMAASLGMMRASFESARDWAKTHKSGGKPIIAYQAVGFKLSEMLTLLQTAELYAFRAAWTAESRPKEAESLTWCAKVFCTEAAETVAGQALRILSGGGFQSGHAAERAYRGAKYNQIAGTSTEMARVHIGDQAMGWR